MTTDKARSLTEQIEASVNQLASETDEARQSELFKTWLNAMAQFSNYSLGQPTTHRVPTSRCFLPVKSPAFIPGANSAATSRKAQRASLFSRHASTAKKPMKPKKTALQPNPSTASGPPMYLAKSDTEGQPLPTLTYGAESGGDELLSRLEWVTEEELNIILDYEEIKEPGVEGYSAGGRIVIRTSLSPTAKAGVIAHELAHELLHKKRQAARCRQQKQTTARTRSGSHCLRCHAPLRHRARRLQLSGDLQNR